MNKKPVIGITCDYDPGNSRTSILVGESFHYLAEDYSKKIVESGGIPILISPFRSEKDNEELLSVCDGIILSGGEDIDPNMYGEEPVKDSREFGELGIERYRKEVPFAKQVLESKLPILAICGGNEALNVACGGTLCQNVYKIEGNILLHTQKAPTWEPTHHVKIEKNSVLYKILKKDMIRVNSFHHQCVKDVGKGLVVAAKAPDGIIESIEVKGRKNVVSVQWHPERLENSDSYQIFEYFIKCCMTK